MKQIYDGYFITENAEVFNKHGKKLSPVDNGKGYLILNLNINGKRKCKAIHRIMAEAFIPNPKCLPEVNHIDANRRNNSIDNLEWVTHGDNIQHSYNMSNRSAKGSNNANADIDEKTVREICELLSLGLKSSKIRDKGYPYNIVRNIKARNTWTHISKDYNF